MSRGFWAGFRGRFVPERTLKCHFEIDLYKEAQILTVSGILLFKLHMNKFVSLEYV